MSDDPQSPETRPGVFVVWGIIGVTALGWYALARNNYDPTLSAAIITSIAAILVSMIGAWWAARATRQATALAHQNNLELQRQEQREQIRGLVQGLYAELKIAQSLYLGQFQEEIENLKPDEHVSYYPVGQDYFTIYNNSSGMVGLISDHQVRTAIINAYMISKGLIDTHLLNNQLVSKYEELHNGNLGHWDGRERSIQVRTAREEAVEYANNVKHNYEEAKAAVSEALRLIENSDYFTGSIQIAPNQKIVQPRP